MHAPGVNPKFLRRALTEIGRAAAASDLRIELAVCHGACLVTAYLTHGRPTPFAVPNGRALALVAGVSEGMRFGPGWLDAELAPFLAAAAADGRLARKARETGVALSVNDGARVLAHKLAVLAMAKAAGGTDADDAARILRGMRAVTSRQVEALCERYCPGVAFGAEAREIVARCLAETEGGGGLIGARR